MFVSLQLSRSAGSVLVVGHTVDLRLFCLWLWKDFCRSLEIWLVISGFAVVNFLNRHSWFSTVGVVASFTGKVISLDINDIVILSGVCARSSLSRTLVLSLDRRLQSMRGCKFLPTRLVTWAYTRNTLMISWQYYAYSDKCTCTAKCSMICKLFVTPSTHKFVSVPA